MANNTNGAAIVEDEPIHEIYASLVQGTGSRKYVAAALPRAVRRTASSATSEAIVLTALSNNDPSVYCTNHEADVIPNNNDCCSTPSFSQFMTFYRKSCREAQLCCFGEVNIGGKQKADQQTCSRDTASLSSSAQRKSEKLTGSKNSRSHSVKMKESHAAKTKCERKRLFKRERERNIEKEKRIRIMLRHDLSEEDELLHMRLTC